MFSYKRRNIASIVLASVLVVPSGIFAQTSALTQVPSELELSRNNLTLRWHALVPLLKIREKVTTLKVRDGMLFAQSNQGVFHAFDAETGEPLWSQAVTGLGNEVFPPDIKKDYIYVTGSKRLVQLERKSGRIRWVKDLPFTATSGPAANDSHCYVNTGDNRMYAISLKDDFGRKFTRRPVAWFYQTRGSLNNAPVLLDDRVVFSSSEGTVYAAHLIARKFFYRYYTHSQTSAPLASLYQWLYIATEDFNLYCIDMRTGFTKWIFPSGFPITTKPVPFFEDVFLLPDGLGLYCLSNETGEVRWLNRKVSRLIAVSQEHLYGADELNNFVILSRKTGERIGSWPAYRFTISTDNQYNDRIYLCSDDGVIICFNEVQNSEPFIHPQSPPGEGDNVDGAGAANPDNVATATDDTSAQERQQLRNSFFDDSIAEEMEKEKNKGATGSFFDTGDDEKKDDKPATKAKSFFDL